MPLKKKCNPSQSLDESFCLPSLRAPPKEIDLERCDIVCEKSRYAGLGYEPRAADGEKV